MVGQGSPEPQRPTPVALQASQPRCSVRAGLLFLVRISYCILDKMGLYFLMWTQKMYKDNGDFDLEFVIKFVAGFVLIGLAISVIVVIALSLP